MSKVVYIIPGFHGTTKMARYRRIAKEFKKNGFKIRPVKIIWNRRVMSDYVAEFLKQIHHNKNDEVYVFGFSFGAMIAFITADQVKPKMLILASLSPFFKEDLKFLKKSWLKDIGKNRLLDLKKFSFNKIVERNNKYKAYLLVGEREDKTLLQKTKKTHQIIKKSKMIVVKNGRHDIRENNYKESLFRIIREL